MEVNLLKEEIARLQGNARGNREQEVVKVAKEGQRSRNAFIAIGLNTQLRCAVHATYGQQTDCQKCCQESDRAR